MPLQAKSRFLTVNVKNGDVLAERGEPVRWLPYGELPYNLE